MAESSPTPALAEAPEEWRALPDHEGHYEVSSLGRVRCLTHGNRWGRFRRATPLLMKAQCNMQGYRRVPISDGKSRRLLSVASLVARTFIGPRPRGSEVAHNDGCCQNDAAANLRYATPTENARDKAIHGTLLRGVTHGLSKLTEDQVREIRAATIIPGSKTRGWRATGERFGITPKNVRYIVSGQTWRHLIPGTSQSATTDSCA